MSNLSFRPDWHIDDRHITPEPAFHNRRHFLRQMGFVGAGLMTADGLIASRASAADASPAASPPAKLYPAKRNPEFNPGWKFSDERIAATYNNFYEFSTTKERVHELVGGFVTAPWKIQIDGLVDKPMTLDARELAEMFGVEERVYRFRCVEAWSMIVPWTGFPLGKVLEKVAVRPGAKFVKFASAMRPNQMPGLARLRGYPWPYTEGLRVDEAMNPLTFIATGIYGKPMPKQHGAPLRIVVPWKYGYKSIKSIERIEFVATQPPTLWHSLAPDEYPFESNVDPRVPHPRWSQATERMIDTGDRVRTLPFNGYEAQVAKLYRKA